MRDKYDICLHTALHPKQDKGGAEGVGLKCCVFIGCRFYEKLSAVKKSFLFCMQRGSGYLGLRKKKWLGLQPCMTQQCNDLPSPAFARTWYFSVSESTLSFGN